MDGRNADVPLLSTLCLTFVLGVLFARAHRDSLSRQEHPLQASGAWLVLAFGVLFWGPLAGYVILSHLPWAVSYWFDAASLPQSLSPLIVLAYAVTPLLGFVVAAKPLMANRNDRALWLLVASLGCTVLTLASGLPRLVVVGTYRQYQQGFGLEQLAGSPLGLTLVWSVFLAGAVVTGVTHRLRKTAELAVRV
jgi:hypothetical protein